MIYYTYDANGYFLRAHRQQVENSTPLAPTAPYATARFVAGAWVQDTNRAQIEAVAARVSDLWMKADRIALNAFDHNSRAKALAWLGDPACPSWRRSRIEAINAWMDGVWGAYYAAAAAVRAGNLAADMVALGACPYAFADLVSE